MQLRFERADEVELALTGVSVRRNGGPLVLRDVNLRLGGPGLVGVTGRSGAGKSTLGRALAGLVPAETGEIRMLHTAESEHPPLYLPQDTKLLNQPVLQTICYPSTDADEEAATSVARALDLLPLLESLGATSVGQDGNAVSGGERRRLALANVLYHHREVFVLDEPLEGVHRALADRATAYLKRLSRTKLVVVITHRPEILKMAEDVIFIARGTVAARGSHSDLLRDCPEYAENFEARTRQDAASPSERVDAAMAGLVTAAQCTQGAQAK